MVEKDRDLIKRLKDVSTRNDAFRELIETYQERLYYHIRRMVGNHDDADDVLQNTFIKVFRYVDKFKGDSALYTWLYKIASNEALSHLKKSKTNLHVSFESHHATGATAQGPDGDEIKAKLMKALETLPEKQRQVFDLKYFSELKYDEISEITGTSVGALKASYFHAVKKIESFLTNH